MVSGRDTLDSSHSRQFAINAMRLNDLEHQIHDTPKGAGPLIKEWTDVCAGTSITNRPQLLPLVLKTFNTAKESWLKTAAAQQVAELAFYFQGATHEETLAGIEGCLCDVSVFAQETGNRRLAALAGEKISSLAAQVKSLDHP